MDRPEEGRDPRDRRRGDPAGARRWCAAPASARSPCSSRETGAPLASRVGVATDIDGAPLILVSMLSAHTPAILADPRCSLLVGEPGKGDPLAHPRLTLICRAVAAGTWHRRDMRAPSAAISTAIPRRSSMPDSAISRSSASSRNAPASMAASARPICSTAPICCHRRTDRRRACGERAIRARPHECRPSRRDRRLCAAFRQGRQPATAGA